MSNRKSESYREPYFPHSGDERDGKTRTAGNQTIMRHAALTADEYLHSAIDNIDARLGAGYAKAHPELIAGFMQTAAAAEGASTAVKSFRCCRRAWRNNPGDRERNQAGMISGADTDGPTRNSNLIVSIYTISGACSRRL